MKSTKLHLGGKDYDLQFDHHYGFALFSGHTHIFSACASPINQYITRIYFANYSQLHNAHNIEHAHTFAFVFAFVFGFSVGISIKIYVLQNFVVLH